MNPAHSTDAARAARLAREQALDEAAAVLRRKADEVGSNTPLRIMLSVIFAELEAAIRALKTTAGSALRAQKAGSTDPERLERLAQEAERASPPKWQPGDYCDPCNNTGEIDCHCGGDLCICGQQQITCSRCDGLAGLADPHPFEDDY